MFTPRGLTIIRLSLLSATVFVGMGIYVAFFPVWLRERGLDATEIGMLLAITPATRIIAAPFVTGLADKRFAPAVLIAIASLGVAMGYGAMSFAYGFWPIALALLLTGLVQSGVTPLADLLLVRETARDPTLRYGRLRVWGSISFVVAMLAVGVLISRFSPNVVVPALAFSALACVGVALIQPRTLEDSAPRRSTGEAPADDSTDWPMLTLAFIVMALLHASHTALYGFGSILWASRGISTDVIGVLWAIGVVAEIILFYVMSSLSSRVEHILGILAIAAGMGVVRWIVMLFDIGTIGTGLLQLLHAGSFGLTHLGGLAAIGALTRPGQRGRVQGLAVAIVSAFMMAMSALSGVVFSRYGAGVFAVMAMLCGLALVFLLIALRQWRRRGPFQPQSRG